MPKTYADAAAWGTAPEPAECAHEDAYPNGYCADCGEPVPDFEPDDDAILNDYLRGYDTKKAA